MAGMLKVKEESLLIFLNSCRIHGEDTIIELLKSLGVNGEKLEKYVVNVVCQEFHVNIDHQVNKIYTSDSRAVMTYFFRKYFNYKFQKISYIIGNIKRDTMNGYMQKINKLDSKIKCDRDLLEKINICEQKILNYIELNKK